jgi:hypothetical protein
LYSTYFYGFLSGPQTVSTTGRLQGHGGFQCFNEASENINTCLKLLINGGWSRLSVDAVVQRLLHRHSLTWAAREATLESDSEQRRDYIAALQSADRYDLRLLMNTYANRIPKLNRNQGYLRQSGYRIAGCRWRVNLTRFHPYGRCRLKGWQLTG